MTTMAEPFFGIPQAAIRSGKIKTLSEVAVKLFVALWHESERYSTRERIYTTKEMIGLAGGCPNSQNQARKQLMRSGLADFEKHGAEGFIVRMCDPATGKPWPGSPKEIYRVKRIAPSIQASPPPAPDRNDVTYNERAISEQYESGESNRNTNFRYGWNERRGFVDPESDPNGDPLARVYGERKQNFVGRHFWARGYMVSTVGRDETVIRDYIRNQEDEDKRLDQLNLCK